MSIRTTVLAAAAAPAAIGLLPRRRLGRHVRPSPRWVLIKTLSDGTVVTVHLTAESATLSPSLGGTPIHRNAWVSGSAQVHLGRTGAESGGYIYPGYTVGCQVDIPGGGVDGGVQGSVSGVGSGGATGNLGGCGGAALSLGPGQATSVTSWITLWGQPFSLG
ncbi:MspA family porin [Nocardia farcinica]|uniref:MspA family porin n=1 Tax=Nocardia farcinica TaxID=37329 RepID=UPI0024567FAF|nr:MspA family porin [Nocardia farcinica]